MSDMKRKFPHLFSPLKVGNVILKNRIISAPMTYPVLTADGCLTPEAIAFYEMRAKGGAAVVTVSEVIVHTATGKGYSVQVLLDAPNAKDSLAAAARAVKRHGAIASVELSHGGKYAATDKKDKLRPAVTYGPSDEYVNGVQTVRAMSKELIQEIVKYLPEGPMYFPKDMITDVPEKFIVAEYIREKILMLTKEEIPHGTAVEVTSMKEREDKDLIDIEATIYCEKESHKKIIIGKHGSMLKAIGSKARIDIENLLNCQVNLQLWVKVKKDWRDSLSALKALGYK